MESDELNPKSTHYPLLVVKGMQENSAVYSAHTIIILHNR